MSVLRQTWNTQIVEVACGILTQKFYSSAQLWKQRVQMRSLSKVYRFVTATGVLAYLILLFSQKHHNYVDFCWYAGLVIRWSTGAHSGLVHIRGKRKFFQKFRVSRMWTTRGWSTFGSFGVFKNSTLCVFFPAISKCGPLRQSGPHFRMWTTRRVDFYFPF